VKLVGAAVTQVSSSASSPERAKHAIDRMSLLPPVTATLGGFGVVLEPVLVVPISGAWVDGFSAPLIRYAIVADLVAALETRVVVAPSPPVAHRYAMYRPFAVLSSSSSCQSACALIVATATPFASTSRSRSPAVIPDGNVIAWLVPAVETAVSAVV
jgi:hypothetical protein